MSTIPAEQVPLWAPLYGAPPVTAVKRVFQKYATFSGRASRSEYWWWALVNFLVYVVLYVPAIVALAIVGSFSTSNSSVPALGIVYLVLLGLIVVWFLGTVVPNIALLVRRVHDINFAGPMALLCFIPVLGIGGIITIVFACMASNPLGRRFDAPNGVPQWQSGMPYGVFPPAPGEPDRPMPPIPGAYGAPGMYGAPGGYAPPQGYRDPQAYAPQGYGQQPPPVAPPSAVAPPAPPPVEEQKDQADRRDWSPPTGS